MRKRLLSLVLAVCMVITMVPAIALAETGAPSYADTDGHWAESAIDRWSDHGVVEGMDGLFDPNGELTRAQMAAIIVRLLNLPAAGDAGFSDVDATEWYAEYINSCAKAGIMLGSDGQARPNDPVSRQESMVLIGRALGVKPAANPDLSGYVDKDSVADWAAGYVAALTDKGIVNGTTDTTVGGTDDINRASMVTILDRAITTVVTEPGAVVEADGAGIIIVAAENVTITGTATGVVVTPESGGEVKLENATVEEAVVVMAPETTVTVGENSEVGIVAVTENAEAAKVEVSEKATVETVETAAPSTEVKVDGTVTNVNVSDTAADTKVDTGKNSTITNVDNKAENTTVTGSGKVENVTTSGNNTTVETGGTKVEAAEGTTGTTAGGKDVAAGESSTTEEKPATPPASSGGGSVSVHSCTLVYAPWNNGTHAVSCNGCDKLYEDEACTIVDGVCTKCKFDEEAVAVVNDIYFDAIEDAVAEVLKAGGTLVMLDDVTLTQGLVFSGENTVLLDMNGKTLSASSTMPSIAMIQAEDGMELTINGYGTVNSASDGNDYNIAVWARGNAEIKIEDGTFINVGGKDYENNGTTPNNNELIYASGDGKIVIEDDPVFYGNTENRTHGAKYTLNIQDDSNASIQVSGGTFYGYDPSKSDSENPRTSFVAEGYIVVEGEEDGSWCVVSAPVSLVKGEETLYYASLQEAIDDAENGDVVNLLKDWTEKEATIKQAQGVSIIIDGNGKELNGMLKVIGNGKGENRTETLTIRNINFVANEGADACIVCPDKSEINAYSYSHNVTVDNCTFTDDDGIVNCAAIRHKDGGDENWTITKCIVSETMHSLLQVNNVQGDKGLIISGCEVYSKNGVNVNNSLYMYMEGCTIDVKGYAVRFGSDANNTNESFEIKNSTLKSACAESGDAVIEFRKGATNATLTLINTTLDGTTIYKGETNATITVKTE